MYRALDRSKYVTGAIMERISTAAERYHADTRPGIPTSVMHPAIA